MRQHWLVWAPMSLNYGTLAADLTETEVIEDYANRYLMDRTRAGTAEGAALTDCMAYPAAPQDAPVWLVVSCGPTPFDASRQYEYYVNRWGLLKLAAGPETWTGGAT